VPVAAAAVSDRAEHAGAGTGMSEAVDGRTTAGTSVALCQTLAAHGLTRHRVHPLGAALVTVTLTAPSAQALAALLSRHGAALPRQAPRADDLGCRAGGNRGGRARRRPPRAWYGRVRTGPSLRGGERRPHLPVSSGSGWQPSLADRPPRPASDAATGSASRASPPARGPPLRQDSDVVRRIKRSD
jgi:hypothetical protein